MQSYIPGDSRARKVGFIVVNGIGRKNVQN